MYVPSHTPLPQSASDRADGHGSGSSSARSADDGHGTGMHLQTAAAMALFRCEPDAINGAPDFVCTFANAGAARLFGRHGADMAGLSVQTLVPPVSVVGCVEILHRVAALGVSEEHELPALCAGKGVSLHWDIAPIPGGVAIALTDLHGRSEMDVTIAMVHKESARADRLSAQVLAQVSDAYLLLDHELRVVTTNPAADRALGRSEALVDRTLWNVSPPGWEKSRVSAKIESVLVDRAEAHLTLRAPIGPAEGEGKRSHAFDIDVYPAPDGGVAIFWRDVTDRVALEDFQREFAAHLTSWNQQLQAGAEEQQRLLFLAEAMRADAESANRVKTEFLAVMSHELRTPLNAIGGYTELLELGLRGPVTPEQREDLGRIQRNQQHLLGLITALLNFARLDTGQLTYDYSDVPVADAVRTAVSLIQPLVDAKQLQLRVDECSLDVQMRTDAEKLQQVLLNLLSNAIKFTNAGGEIIVRCARVSDMVTVAVSDTGVGIPERHLARIFEPFVQVDVGLSRTVGGVGLGLSISANLARALGGSLRVESSEGCGSTFTLSLPVIERS